MRQSRRRVIIIAIIVEVTFVIVANLVVFECLLVKRLVPKLVIKTFIGQSVLGLLREIRLQSKLLFLSILWDFKLFRQRFLLSQFLFQGVKD